MLERTVILFLATGFALAQRVEFEGRYWIADSALRAKIKSRTFDQEIDFKRDLAIPDENAPDVRFTFRSRGRSRVVFGYDQIGYSSDANVTRTVEFNNRIYTVGTRVLTNLDLKHVKLGWTYYLIDVAGGKFKLGPMVEGHGLWWDASLRAPNVNIAESDKRSVGFPTLGAAAEINPHRAASLFVEASGLSVGQYGFMVTGEGGGRLIPHKNLSIAGGYRILRINPKFEPDYANLRIAGPFIGASVRF